MSDLQVMRHVYLSEDLDLRVMKARGRYSVSHSEVIKAALLAVLDEWDKDPSKAILDMIKAGVVTPVPLIPPSEADD